MSSTIILACKFLFKKSKLKLEVWYLSTRLTNVGKAQKGIRFVPFLQLTFLFHMFVPQFLFLKIEINYHKIIFKCLS
jgi:hypothetical protein